MIKEIYTLGENLVKMDTHLAESGGELTEELMGEYFAISQNFDQAVIDGAFWIKAMEDEETLLRREATRLEERARAIKQRQASARKLMAASMVKSGRKSIKEPRVSVSAREGEAKVVIRDESLLPAEFFTAPAAEGRRLNLEKLTRLIDQGMIELPCEAYDEPSPPSPTPDKETLKVRLQSLPAGETIPGAELQRQYILTIK